MPTTSFVVLHNADGTQVTYRPEIVAEPELPPVEPPEEPPVEVPGPDPESEPVDEPPAVVLPSDEKPGDFIVEVDRENYVLAQDLAGQGYARHQEYLEWSIGAKNTLTLWNLNGSDAQQYFPADKEFRLIVDGKVIATRTLLDRSKTLQFAISDEEVLRHEFNIYPTLEGYSTFPFAVFVYHGRPSAWMSAITSSHEFSQEKTYVKAHVNHLPAVFDPKVQQLEPKEYVPLRGHPRLPDLVSRMIVVDQGSTPRRPSITKKGVWTTFGAQGYHFHTVIHKPNIFPLIEGPRGVASIQGITSLFDGLARKTTKDSSLVGNLYGTTSTSFFKVRQDQSVVVLLGDVMPAPGMYFEDGQRPEQRGDFSGIPEGRPKHFNELWKFIWNEKSTQVDEDAPWVMDENGIMRPPHPTNVRGYLLDAFNATVYLATMPTKQGGEVKVTEFITDMLEPFGGFYWRGKLILSDRLGNQIRQYDAETGAFEKVILSGASGLASVQNNTTRQIKRHATLEEIRAEDCVMPESCELVIDEFGNEEGKMVFSSATMAQVKRFNLLTEEFGKTANIRETSGGLGIMFSSICLSDGTFGDLGMAMVAQYQESKMEAYLEDGTKWAWAAYPPKVIYNMCGWIRNGRFTYGGSGMGIYEISLRTTEEPINASKVARGRAKWIAMGYDQTHSPVGFPYDDRPLPWGVDEEIDYRLTALGHK